MTVAVEQCPFPDLCMPHWERLLSMTQPLVPVSAHMLEAALPFDVQRRSKQDPAYFSQGELGYLKQ